jgi:hypothetical protein
MGVGGNPCRSDVSGMERLRVAPHRLLQGKDAEQSNHDLLKGGLSAQPAESQARNQSRIKASWIMARKLAASLNSRLNNRRRIHTFRFREQLIWVSTKLAATQERIATSLTAPL